MTEIQAMQLIENKLKDMRFSPAGEAIVYLLSYCNDEAFSYITSADPLLFDYIYFLAAIDKSNLTEYPTAGIVYEDDNIYILDNDYFTSDDYQSSEDYYMTDCIYCTWR